MNAFLRHAITYLTFALVAAAALALIQAALGGTSFLVWLLGAVLAFVVWSILFNPLREILDYFIPPAMPSRFELDRPGALRPRRYSTEAAQEEIEEMRQRVQELKMLGQYSEALNFTINFDAMLWLIYTNCQGVLDSRDFYVHITDVQTGQLYTAFFVEDNQRRPEREGTAEVLDDRRVLQVIEIGQVYEYEAADGRHWLLAPLNAGADTVGALQASHKEIGQPFAPEALQIFGQLANRTATALDHWLTNQQLGLRAQQLETLNDVIHTINSEIEVQPLLDLILAKGIELLNVEAGSFLLVDEDTGELEFRVSHGPSSEELVGTRLPMGTGIAGKVAQTGTPLILNDVHDERQWFSGIDDNIEFRTRSMLTVPLMRQRRVLGVLQMVNRRNGLPFTRADETMMAAFAGEAAVALENARLLQQTDQQLQERVRELTLLQNLDRDLNRTLDLSAVLKLTLSWIMRLFDGTAAGIVIFDEQGNLLLAERQGSDGRAQPSPNAKLSKYPGLIGEVARTGLACVTNDVEKNDRYLEVARGIKSQMTIPIVHEQRTVGAAAIESDRQNAYDDADLEAAVRLINHITFAISNALLYGQVKAANNAKSEFVSVVSHELKTPLTAIRGYTDLMLSGLTGEVNKQQSEYMHTIINNVNRMMTQIQDLTDVSRMDTGQLAVNLQPIPFANVVSETITSIQSLADAKDIAIHLEMNPDIPLVMGDHARLVQVLTNLISNACKYSPSGTDVCVSVTHMQGVNGQRPHVRCAVKDNGYGISATDQKKLFTRFFRSENPDVRNSPGTGLGLSITRGLIELHGGEIGFESQLGEGTTFYFTLQEAAA